MQRFYFEAKLWWNLFIDDKDFFHQISHVLRSLIWDLITVFNWDSFDYIYEIVEITKKWIKLSLKEKIKNTKDNNLTVNLFQSVPNKYEKIEYILQKWVEIGIRNFTFYQSERSQKLVINDKKIDRFKFIIKESLEQCGGNIMPELNFVNKINFKDLVWDKIACHTKIGNSISLKDYQISNNLVNVFVWPEWWFSDREILEFQNNWAQIINFWERILRTETTWIVLWFHLLNK